MSLLSLIISFVLLLLSFILDAERDTISFRPHQSWFPDSKYWTQKSPKGNTILQRTIIAAFGDGWHLLKTFYLWSWQASFVIILCAYLSFTWYLGFIIWLILWLFNGIIFELTYGNRPDLIPRKIINS